jgi:hypothetical protein
LFCGYLSEFVSMSWNTCGSISNSLEAVGMIGGGVNDRDDELENTSKSASFPTQHSLVLSKYMGDESGS